jgi:hypothetical protein
MTRQRLHPEPQRQREKIQIIHLPWGGGNRFSSQILVVVSGSCLAVSQGYGSQIHCPHGVPIRTLLR